MEQIVVDLGNSRIVTGHFKNKELSQKWYHPLSNLDAAFQNICNLEEASKGTLPVVVSSVVPSSSGRLVELLNRKEVPNRLLNLKEQSIIQNIYPTMGTDRLANLVAAHKLHGQGNNAIIVLDFGTATTLSAVDAQGKFLGGFISLGLNNTLQSVNQNLEQLPILELDQDIDINKLTPLNTTTEEAIFNGAILGHFGMIERWLHCCKATIDSPYKTIATGGLAKIVAKHLDEISLIDEDLTLKGINFLGASVMDQADQV